MNGSDWTLMVAAALVMTSCATVPRPRCPAAGEAAVRPLELEAGAVTPSPLEAEMLAELAPGEGEGVSPEVTASALVGELHVLAWAGTGEEGGDGGVVVARREGGRPVVAARRGLPGLEDAHPAETIELALSVRDLDGDGRADLLVRYAYGTEPQPAVGGDTHERVGIFALPGLAPKWEGEINLLPGGSYYRRCEGELGLADGHCDGHADLVLTQTCGDGVCFEEPESWDAEDRKLCAQPESRPEARVERFRWSDGGWR